MSGMLPWYVARSSGLIAWALLAASVLWGLAISTRVLRGTPRPSWLLDLHRYLGGIATAFVGVHIVALLGDTYVHFGLASVLVPFAGSWHPVAVAWGVTAFYVLLAVDAPNADPEAPVARDPLRELPALRRGDYPRGLRGNRRTHVGLRGGCRAHDDDGRRPDRATDPEPLVASSPSRGPDPSTA